MVGPGWRRPGRGHSFEFLISFLVRSLVASAALTVVLNVVIRAFPGTSADARARQVFGEHQERVDEMPSLEDAKRIRLFFPWRQIVMWSVGVTLLLNVIALID